MEAPRNERKSGTEIGEWEAGPKALAGQHRNGEAENAREPTTQHVARVESRVSAKGEIQGRRSPKRQPLAISKPKKGVNPLIWKSQKTEWKKGTHKQTHRGENVADKKEHQECWAIRQE